MNIGFDAKRAFHNHTGLGNYSRTLINGLAQYYPQHHYFLFNPKPSSAYSFHHLPQVQEVQPSGAVGKSFPAAWRTYFINKDLKRLGVNIYHGLTHEIPLRMRESGTRSVVTIHDLIFEKFPAQYNTVDRHIYRRKFLYACKNADKIIAISEQTKKDLIEVYNVPQGKIDVCYQSCNPVFGEMASAETIERMRKKYGLPSSFLLYVGSVIERKNLLGICKALGLLKNEVAMPLVVIGRGKKYKQKVQAYLQAHRMEQQVLFLEDQLPKSLYNELGSVHDLAAIYQMATAFIYPSFYEGFGLPVLEALLSRTPVITALGSCMEETGGDAAYYVAPDDTADIAKAIKTVWQNNELAATMVEKGLLHAAHFNLKACTDAVMQVYQKLV